MFPHWLLGAQIKKGVGGCTEKYQKDLADCSKRSQLKSWPQHLWATWPSADHINVLRTRLLIWEVAEDALPHRVEVRIQFSKCPSHVRYSENSVFLPFPLPWSSFPQSSLHFLVSFLSTLLRPLACIYTSACLSLTSLVNNTIHTLHAGSLTPTYKWALSQNSLRDQMAEPSLIVF